MVGSRRDECFLLCARDPEPLFPLGAASIFAGVRWSLLDLFPEAHRKVSMPGGVAAGRAGAAARWGPHRRRR